MNYSVKKKRILRVCDLCLPTGSLPV